jgi:hypothetical protein
MLLTLNQEDSGIVFLPRRIIKREPQTRITRAPPRIISQIVRI